MKRRAPGSDVMSSCRNAAAMWHNPNKPTDFLSYIYNNFKNLWCNHTRQQHRFLWHYWDSLQKQKQREQIPVLDCGWTNTFEKKDCLSKLDHFPKTGMKTKHISNHHLVTTPPPKKKDMSPEKGPFQKENRNPIILKPLRVAKVFKLGSTPPQDASGSSPPTCMTFLGKRKSLASMELVYFPTWKPYKWTKIHKGKIYHAIPYIDSTGAITLHLSRWHPGWGSIHPLGPSPGLFASLGKTCERSIFSVGSVLASPGVFPKVKGALSEWDVMLHFYIPASSKGCCLILKDGV